MAAGGTVSKMSAYVTRGLSGAVTYAIALAIICAPPLAGAIMAGPAYGRVAVGAYIGLVTMFAAGSATGDITHPEDLSDHGFVRALITGIVWLYLNGMMVISMALGGVVAAAGAPSLGLVVAILFPTIDAHLSEWGFPLVHWLTSTTIWLLQLIASLVGQAQARDALAAARERMDSAEAVYTAFSERIRLSVAAWI